MDDFLKSIGKNIKRQRKEVIKISQSQLAYNIGCNINTISNIENGKVPAGIDTLYKMAKALDIEPYKLLKTSEIDIGTINHIYNLFNKITSMNNDNIRKFIENIEVVTEIFNVRNRLNKKDREKFDNMFLKSKK